MSWDLVVWLAALIMQSALLGRSMYAVRRAGEDVIAGAALRKLRSFAPPTPPFPRFCDHPHTPPNTTQHITTAKQQIMSLSDLENDFLNPFDLCGRLNRYVVRRR